MPNLFPTITINTETEPGEIEAQNKNVLFGKSWHYDFEKGDFTFSPVNGKVAESNTFDAWINWCKKALITERYRFLAYGRNYGQEFEKLISQNLTRPGNESEIRRLVTECLMADPRTASVDNFTFSWQEDKCFFSCVATNILEQSGRCV